MLGRKDAVFILPAVSLYKTNTSSVGCWFEKQLYDPDLQQVCSHLLLFSCPYTRHATAAGHFTLEYPWSKWRFPINSWRRKVSKTGLSWSIAAQKSAEKCTAHGVHLISLHGFLAYLQMLLLTFAVVKAGGLFLPQDLE